MIIIEQKSRTSLEDIVADVALLMASITNILLLYLLKHLVETSAVLIESIKESNRKKNNKLETKANRSNQTTTTIASDSQTTTLPFDSFALEFGTTRLTAQSRGTHFRKDPITHAVCPERVQKETGGIENPDHCVLDFVDLERQFDEAFTEEVTRKILKDQVRQKLAVHLSEQAKIIYLVT
jgi:hypothetical protein